MEKEAIKIKHLEKKARNLETNIQMKIQNVEIDNLIIEMKRAN